MLHDLKETSKHTSIYAIGNIVIKIIGVFLIPLYTNANYLSHDDYGALAVLEATSQILVGVLAMAMASSLTRWYWDENYIKDQKTIFFTTLSFLFILVIPICFLLILVSDNFSDLLFQTKNYSSLIKLTIIASALQILNNQIFCLVKLQSRSGLYSFLQIFKVSITIGLILWWILLKGKGLDGIWKANVIGELVILILLFPYVLKNIKIRFRFDVLTEMLTYGLPLMLGSISGVILVTADRYMLSSMSNLEKTGVYSLGFRIANTLKLVISASFALALTPLRMQKMDKTENKRFYSKTNTYTTFIFAYGLLGLALFSLELIKILSGSKVYWDSINIIPIIAYALLFGLLKENVTIALIITKKTKIIGIILVLISLLNILLNYILIPKWDIYGAAFATLFSQFVFFILLAYVSQKAYFIPYEWNKISKMIILSFIYVGLGIMVSNLDIWIRLTIKFFLFASFPFILHLCRFYDEVELKNIRNILKAWKNPKNLKDNFKRFIK